uniref:Uncharacterized protein n=1 Tax=Opuntia streptacantha TaxID=393608 RepID=A0A7C8YT43_OPUST
MRVHGGHLPLGATFTVERPKSVIEIKDDQTGKNLEQTQYLESFFFYPFISHDSFNPPSFCVKAKWANRVVRPEATTHHLIYSITPFQALFWPVLPVSNLI